MMELSWMQRVEGYLKYRRKLGFDLQNDASRLFQFAKFAEQSGKQDHLTIELCVCWAQASQKQSAITWDRRIAVVRGFAKYLQRFEPSTDIPPLGLFGPVHRRLIPHIFTDAEVVALLKSTDQLVPRCGLRPATCRTVFGLLSATGLRISEALDLTRADVDLVAGVLNVREAKCHRQRLVPLHPTVMLELRVYATFRAQIVRMPRNEHFFLLDSGKPANKRGMLHALHVLCRHLDWLPRGDYQLHRLHDFRHTFIVHSALCAYKQGIDVDKHILALSTYVGHVKVADTYWYFTGIPELMSIAADRFHDYSQGGTK